MKLARVLRALGIRRRTSTKLTPKYEDRRTRELRNAREAFNAGRAGA